MCRVVNEIEARAAKKDSGVVIVKGQEFIQQKYWEDLEQYHERRVKREGGITAGRRR